MPSPALARAAAAAAAAAVVFAGCSVGGSDRPVPRIPHAFVDVTVREYGFDYKQPVPAGRVVFRVRNAGRQIHRLTMIELPEDLPPIAEQLRGRKRRNVNPFAGLPGMRPGETNSFAVDLVSGRRYGMIDPTGNVGGKSYAVLGLSSEFRAGGGRPGPRPGADAQRPDARKPVRTGGARRAKPNRKASRRATRPSRRARRASRRARLVERKPGAKSAPQNAGVGPAPPP